MFEKTYVPDGENTPDSQIGATLEALAATIAVRREAGEESYTYRLLHGSLDTPLKKVMEEAGEVALAAKDVEALPTCAADAGSAGSSGSVQSLEQSSSLHDCGTRLANAAESSEAAEAMRSAAVDHLRYEAADVVYHLLVVLERFGVSLDEFAAELNNRMAEGERPEGAIRLRDEYVKRGK